MIKSIELSKDRKSKLLEMCKTLFPNYVWSTNQIGLGYENYVIASEWHNQAYNEIQQYNSIIPLPKTLFSIHWFEFCLTHLSKRLLNPNDFMFYQTTGNFNYLHPVDYLYQQFIKLKL